METGDFMARPGVMFYFDVRPCLKRLTDEDKGRLFEAILDFGEFGVIPDFDGALGVAWDFIQPRIERDSKRYESIVEKRTQAARARWAKEGQPVSDANECTCIPDVPTTTPNTTTKTISSSKSKADTAGGGLGEEMSFEDRRQKMLAMLQNHQPKGG